MANKYIIEGATYNGDGTTSSEAASAGAAGAWNNINIITGTAVGFGTLAAGDTVYIRSKTSAGADIAITSATAVSCGSASATTTSPITWVLDDGKKWPGISGRLSITLTGSVAITLRASNIFISNTQDSFVFANSEVSAGSNVGIILTANSVAEKCLIDFSANTANHGHFIFCDERSTLISPHIRSHNRFGALIQSGGYGASRIIAPDIELLNPSEIDAVFLCGQYGGKTFVIGGGVRGAGATTGVPIRVDGNNGDLFLYNFKFPQTMTVMGGTPHTVSRVYGYGVDGNFGAIDYSGYAQLDSRQDANYPTLSATFPDSVSTPWSWKAYPVGVSKLVPLTLTISKVFTDTTAIKTLTIEMLIASAFVSVNKESVQVSISYTQSDGSIANFSAFSTEDTGALVASTAAWSATTYGPVSCDKRKIALTTPTAIKKDTTVTAHITVSARSSNANDILFICPDIQISTP